MAWNYDYYLNDLELATVCKAVVVESEGGNSWADSTQSIPHRDGGTVDDLATVAPLELGVTLVFRWTDSAGDITHPDGEGGHIYQGLAAVKRELARPSLATFRRTTPDAGRVRARCKLLAPPIVSGDRNRYGMVLTVPSGSWQEDTESTALANAVVTAGSYRISDPTVVFPAAGTVIHTNADGVVSTITSETGPTFPVTVTRDESTGFWTAVDDNGDDARGFVTWTRPWVLRMDPDGAQTFTGTLAATATVKWRNRW